MKPYGVPRNDDVANPDLGDIQKYGLASHIGNLPGKNGEIRSIMSSGNRRRTRRIWKRKARNEGKIQIIRSSMDE